MVVGFVGENLLLVAVRQLYRTDLEARMPMDLSIQMSHVFEHSGDRLYSVIGNGTCLLEMNTSLASPFQCYFETFFWSK